MHSLVDTKAVHDFWKCGWGVWGFASKLYMFKPYQATHPYKGLESGTSF